MTDTPALQDQFGHPGGQQPGCGFPVAHFMALFHASTGLVLKMLNAPLRTYDLSQEVKLHPTLQADKSYKRTCFAPRRLERMGYQVVLQPSAAMG